MASFEERVCVANPRQFSNVKFYDILRFFNKIYSFSTGLYIKFEELKLKKRIRFRKRDL